MSHPNLNTRKCHLPSYITTSEAAANDDDDDNDNYLSSEDTERLMSPVASAPASPHNASSSDRTLGQNLVSAEDILIQLLTAASIGIGRHTPERTRGHGRHTSSCHEGGCQSEERETNPRREGRGERYFASVWSSMTNNVV